MVKKVVSPARTSVVNLVFWISWSLTHVSERVSEIGSVEPTCPEPSRRNIRPKVDLPTTPLNELIDLRMVSIMEGEGKSSILPKWVV
jgi:hypothetical protein